MKKLFFLFSFIFLCSHSYAADTVVMDVYTGNGTPCYKNDTYSYTVEPLQYGCIIEKGGTDSVLLLNGKENTTYSGVESFSFSNSGALIVNLKKGNLHSLVFGSYQSDWYTYAPVFQSNSRGDFVITTQDKDGYGWIYNGKVMATGLSQSPTVIIDSFDMPIVLDTYSKNGSYDRIFRGDTQILGEYSSFIYEGTFMKKSKNTIVLLARKGDRTVLLSLSNTGSVTRLADVAYNFEDYPFFTMSYDNPSQFAFVVKDNDKYRIVTNKGLLPGRYDSVNSISIDPKHGLIKQVTKDGKFYFSVGTTGYGPYDNIYSVSTSVSGDHWYMPVQKGGKDYLVMDGREVAF